MTERIPLRYTVSLQGFSEFERSALASFFRLAEARAPAYGQAHSLSDADFIVADADHAAALAAVRGADRMQDTVFVGAHEPPGAAAWLHRPIEPTHIVRQLDLLLEQRLASLDEPAATDWGTSGPGVLEPDPHTAKDVLVVDDSRVAARFLQVRLQRMGYRVHVAQTPEEALQQLQTLAFAIVFLDVALGDHASMDGLALCQRIKQAAPAGADTPPRVAMVTGLASSSDRVRGALAGCDEYLTKPLMEPDFLDALNRLDPARTPA